MASKKKSKNELTEHEYWLAYNAMEQALEHLDSAGQSRHPNVSAMLYRVQQRYRRKAGLPV